MLQTRKEIKTLHIVAIVETTTPNNTRQAEYEVWISGKYFRSDLLVQKSSNRQDAMVGQRVISCRNCEREGYTLETTQGNDVKTAIVFSKIENTNTSAKFHIDWIGIGLMNADIFKSQQVSPQNEVDSVLKQLRKDGSRYQIEDVGNGRVGFSITTAIGNIIKYQFANASHPDPTQIYYKLNKLADGSQGNYVKQTTTDYSSFDNYSHPFPRVINYHLREEEKTIVKQTTTITVVDINKEIDPKLFTLKGMGIKDGTPIEYPEITDRSKHPVWRRDQIDPDMNRGQQALAAHILGSNAAPLSDIPPPSFLSRSWPYLVGASVLAAVGFFLLRKMRKQPA